jgi:hypothetical protein
MIEALMFSYPRVDVADVPISKARWSKWEWEEITVAGDPVGLRRYRPVRRPRKHMAEELITERESAA